MDYLVEFNKKQATRKTPKIKAGDTVKVHQKIKEGEKERIQIFEGVVIKIHGGYGQNGTFTVRKIASGIGVEKIFPFMLPSISKIDLVKRGKVRRAKLYYLREKQQKEARLKEKKLSEEEKMKASYDEEVEKEKEKAKAEENKEKEEGKKEPEAEEKKPIEEKKEVKAPKKEEKPKEVLEKKPDEETEKEDKK